MNMRRWSRLRPESTEGGLGAFRQGLLATLAACTFYGIWIAVPWAIVPADWTGRQYAVVGWGTCLAMAAFFLRRNWLRFSCWLFVLGSLVLDCLVILAFPELVTLFLLALTVVVSGLLLGPIPGALATIAAMLVALLPGIGIVRFAVSPLWAVLLSVTGGVGALTGYTLPLIDYWEQQFVVRQAELVEQLRAHQGELNRTLKALDEAYVSLKRTNDELIVSRQEAEEARGLKEQFVANVSHELRTPLNLIVGFAEIMYLAPESYDGVLWTPDLEGDIQEMYRAAKYLQSLVNDILDLSRIDAARLPMFRELGDIRTIIQEAAETISPLLEQCDLSYSLESPGNLPQLFVDRTRIRQVMLNLFSNSIRYTDKGSISVHVEQTANTVVVSVHDTGIGIPGDQLESIFEEFHQVSGGPHSRGGVGLGLALCRQFVELHGGRIWAESQVGVGSTFYFSLPLPGATPQTAPLYRLPGRKHLDLSKAPVVVVDPDPTIAEMLARYLGDHPMLSARDPEEAEALIECEHPLAVIANHPRDVPEATWLSSLGERSERYDVPVLRCSIPSPSWLQQASGLDDCLTKPVSRESLQRTITKYAHLPGTILVVDDDPGFVSLMTRVLGTLEPTHEVLTAYSGTQALRLAQERKPQLILLDLLMPEVDGMSVVRALRQDPALRDTIVIAVTATSYAEEILSRQGSHFTLTQSQGISPGTLVELLNAALQVVRPNYVGGESTLPRA